MTVMVNSLKIINLSTLKPEASASCYFVFGSGIAAVVHPGSEVEVAVVGLVDSSAFCWPDCRRWEHSELAS